MKWMLVPLALAWGFATARAEDVPLAQYRYSRDTGLIEITASSMDRPADPVRRYVHLVGHESTLLFDGFEAHRRIDQDWLDDHAESRRKLLCGSK